MALPKTSATKTSKPEGSGVRERPQPVVEEKPAEEPTEAEAQAPASAPAETTKVEPEAQAPAPAKAVSGVNPAGYATTSRFKLRNPTTGELFHPANSSLKPCVPKKMDGWLKAQLAAKTIVPL